MHLLRRLEPLLQQTYKSKVTYLITDGKRKDILRRQLRKRAVTTYYTIPKDSYTNKTNRFTINPVIEEQLLASHMSLDLPQAIIHFDPLSTCKCVRVIDFMIELGECNT
jgi:GTPase Era involved in 16S rRNA processing